LDVLDRIDGICDRFEAAWKSGARPRVDDYLGDVDQAYRSVLLHDLLAVEIAARHHNGERPLRHEYVDRFPGDAEVIEAIFAEAEPAGVPPPNPGVSSLGDPAKIARYTILGRLGRGGFGQVYLAHDEDLDRRVAIRCPGPSVSPGQRISRRT
jgi:serine/threonine-protein kinase